MRLNILFAAFLSLVASSSAHELTAPCKLSATTLSVEYLPSPYSTPRITDSKSPRLSWKFVSTSPQSKNQTQSAYRIQVASTAALLAANTPDVWDSGVVSSGKSTAVTYQGPARPPRSLSVWRVEVWDESGGSCGPLSAGDFSAWETPIDAAGWKGAEWLTADAPPPTPPTDCDFYTLKGSPLFRTDVTLPAGADLSQARAYIAGVGYFTLTINGAELPDAGALDPGFTSFNKTLLFSTLNATQAILAAAAAASPPGGVFTVGVALGNGWYNPLPLRFWGSRNWRNALAVGEPTFKLALYLDFHNAPSMVVNSRVGGGGWLVGGSHILRNNIYLGTVTDRSLEPVGWDVPGFTSPLFHAPYPAITYPTGALKSAYVPPVKRHAPLITTTIPTPHSPAVVLMDAGRQMSGVCRFCLKGPRGTTITFRFGELLGGNGTTLNAMTSVAGQIKSGNGGPCAPPIAFQEDTYSLRGGGVEECFTPPFVWHAFRYIEATTNTTVSGGPGALLTSPLQCFPMYTDIPTTSTFASSNPTLNAIHALDVNTARCNMMSIQSDCPHRERLGYGGDALMSYETIAINFDTPLFHEKRVRDYADAALPDGGLPETAPNVGISDAGMTPGGGPIGWQTFLPAALAYSLRYHGNLQVVKDLYPTTQAYVSALKAVSDRSIEEGLGDWMTLEPPALGLTGWGFAHLSHASFAALALAVGDAPSAATATADALAARGKLNDNFLSNSTPGLYSCIAPACYASHQFNRTQCGQAMPLYMGIVPPGQAQEGALQLLVDNVLEHTSHLQVGAFGVKWLLMALGDGGRADLAYAILNQTDYPSFGYMMSAAANGVENATTAWESWSLSESTFSHNHPMFASGSTYLFQSLAGIKLAPDALAADKLILAPSVPPYSSGLTFVNATWDTVAGTVSSAWQWVNATTLSLQFTLPPNVQAQLTLPLSKRTLQVGSGLYSFTDTA